MPHPYMSSIRKAVGEVHVLLGFMVIKAPTFEDPVFPRRNVESVFRELNEGLETLRVGIAEDQFLALRALSDEARASFEADPEDINGRTRNGRQLLQDMEAIVVSIATGLAPPDEMEDDLAALARRLDTEDYTEAEFDSIMNRLEGALPHGDIIALLAQNNPELTAEEAVDEALRREAEWREKNS